MVLDMKKTIGAMMITNSEMSSLGMKNSLKFGEVS